MLVGWSLTLLTSPHMYVGSTQIGGWPWELRVCSSSTLPRCTLLPSWALDVRHTHFWSAPDPAGHVHALCWFNASSLFSVCPADFELCKPVWPEVLIHKPAWGPFNSGIKKVLFLFYHHMGWITVLLAKPIYFLSCLLCPVPSRPQILLLVGSKPTLFSLKSQHKNPNLAWCLFAYFFILVHGKIWSRIAFII